MVVKELPLAEKRVVTIWYFWVSKKVEISTQVRKKLPVRQLFSQGIRKEPKVGTVFFAG